ncbi:hypothetical protein I131_08620 [Enterococcus faecium CRL1879]|nr:hypothetical protein I131_08620 [Enterococcus faecium CRL1879]
MGEVNNSKSSRRLQIEAQLDCLDENELVIVGNVIKAIYGDKCKID